MKTKTKVVAPEIPSDVIVDIALKNVVEKNCMNGVKINIDASKPKISKVQRGP